MPTIVKYYKGYSFKKLREFNLWMECAENISQLKGKKLKLVES